ncbi:hypothetical protein [Brevundimonas nasdae]|uniref:Uncharacterized protein n=1 Tax=Brevundimonas nasdae TaxID=172043 RepID=A0ABX8TIG9_9CAUL|nr:hypothetical protein [Brevundimonas nasdae]QYC10195.1 hypothetical protein KWG56_16815 [Brevundimonas nasdae]QYC12984.1 hypothetical protein KWG63_12135 [Brevundimonas nasdae]
MEWAARAIGVFYVVGGLLLLSQSWLNWRLQWKLSRVVRIRLADHVEELTTALGGAMVLLSGLALALLSTWAVAAFVAGWVIQAIYLLWASRGAWSRSAFVVRCRRQSVHAFAGFTAVTALVLCLPLLGLLR